MAVYPKEQRTESNLVKIQDLINEKTVFLLDKRYRSDVLDALVAKAAELGLVMDVPLLKSAIDAREALCSTAIGDEIAIPHAKIPTISSFFVMTAVVKTPVEWDAPDQKAVRIVFLIGGPDDDQAAYLGLLAQIMRKVKDSDRRANILSTTSAAEIARILTR